MKVSSIKGILTAVLCAALAVVSAFAVPVTAEAGTAKGFKKIDGNEIVVFKKQKATTIDEDGFEGALAYGATKRYELADNCKFYVWGTDADGGICKEKVSKEAFLEKCPKAKKYEVKDGVKYFGCEFVTLKVKDGKVVKVTMSYRP